MVNKGHYISSYLIDQNSRFIILITTDTLIGKVIVDRHLQGSGFSVSSGQELQIWIFLLHIVLFFFNLVKDDKILVFLSSCEISTHFYF